MNALVQKEARLLLPSFVIGLLLTASVWIIPSDPDPASGLRTFLFVFPFLLCPAMAVMTALDSFGREFSSGTFSNLLAQPVARARVWWTKTTLLAVALAVIFCAWWAFYLLANPNQMTARELRDLFMVTAMFVLVTFAGGLWTVLLFRQVAVAFWFTLIAPAALLMATVQLMEKHPNEITAVVVVIVFVSYSVAGFLWARRMFLRAQDVAWTGGTIALPEWRGMPSLLAGPAGRQQNRPRAALFAKEFQLHQSQLVVAGVLALLHLSVIATRKFGGGFKDSPTWAFVLDQFWILWLAMPLLVGCAAVAEERKLGTLEGQLCLSVRLRTQFVIKFVSALLVSVLLGAVMPVLLEGSKILPDVHPRIPSDIRELYFTMPGGIFIQTIAYAFEAMSVSMPFLVLAGIAAGIAIISFYASTLSHNTLQALAPATFGLVVTGVLLLGASQIEEVFHYPLWRGWLVYLLGVPVMTLTLAGLMYWNYKRALVGWNVWRRNALVFFASLACVMAVTTAIYHRAWERLTPLEPPHGAARLNPSQPVTIRRDGWSTTIQLPDGRHWLGRLTLSVPNWAAVLSGDWKVTEIFGGGRFLEGTNWASVALCYRDVVGIQKDGSLWVSEQPAKLFWSWSHGRSPRPELAKFVRLGHDNDWKSVVGHQSTEVFLLKTGGTLWRLGTNLVERRTEWPGLRAFEPRSLGTDSDWAEISSTEGRTTFRKTDGWVWVYPKFVASDTNSINLDGETRIYRALHLDRLKSVASVWPPSGRFGGFQVGVREDGKFLVTAVWQSLPGTHPQQWGYVKQDVQLGKDSGWLAVGGEAGVIVTLRADGSLWKWSFPHDPIIRPDTASAALLSTHSDWVALTAAMGGVISLAADGSLWFWQFDPRRFYPSEHTLPPLLAASRRPQLIGNIFASSAQ